MPSTNADCSQTPVCVYHYKARVSRTQPSPSHMTGKIQRFMTKMPIRIRRCIVKIRSHPTPLHTVFDLNGSDAKRKVIECKKHKIVEKVSIFVNTKKHDCYWNIRLSRKCLSFANVLFTTVHRRTNVKLSQWNVTVFISTEQNRSYVIRRNNIKRKTLCVYYFLIKQKKLFGQPNICIFVCYTGSTA